jgi:hypothetical protein
VAVSLTQSLRRGAWSGLPNAASWFLAAGRARNIHGKRERTDRALLLDCGQISYKRFTVLAPDPHGDPHGFDGDHDGIRCEK